MGGGKKTPALTFFFLSVPELKISSTKTAFRSPGDAAVTSSTWTASSGKSRGFECFCFFVFLPSRASVSEMELTLLPPPPSKTKNKHHNVYKKNFRWLKTRSACPLCNKEWEFAKIEKILQGGEGAAGGGG